MKLLCDCGAVSEFKEKNDITGKENSYDSERGLYVTIKGVSFWSEHDVAGLVCDSCNKAIWLFT